MWLGMYVCQYVCVDMYMSYVRMHRSILHIYVPLYVSMYLCTFNIPTHVGGCQNYGPFLGPYYNTAPII